VIDPREREELKAALLEESLEELYDNAPCGYVSTAPDGTFAKVNQTFLDWTGYTRDDLLGVKRFQDLLTIGGRIFYETHCAPLLHMQGFVQEIAFDLLCHDGRRLPTLLNSIQKRDPFGAPLLYRTTIFNASDRREYEQELLAARKKAEQATDSLTRLYGVMAALGEASTPLQVAEVIVHHGAAALHAQAGLVAVVGADRASLEIIHAIGYQPELINSWQHISLDSSMPLADAVRSGQPVLMESPDALATHYPQLAILSASFGTQSVIAIPLGVNGRPIGVLGLSFAESQLFTAEAHAFLLTLARQCAIAMERARLYEAEHVARTEAQEAVQTRDAFLAIASHELRNPLTSLLANAQLLQRRLSRAGALSDRLQRSVNVIASQAVRLDQMIKALLDVSQMGAGQLAISPTMLDLAALIRRIVTEVQPALAQHTLIFEDPGTSLMIHGDGLRLDQVVQNLLQNAVKYSPAGGLIVIRAEQQRHVACVTVTDQGIGIPMEAQSRLFQRFYRAARSQTSGISGMGIGLYMVREIISLHNGSVAVESQEGIGSTFTVTLPLAYDHKM
jgi:PAS domain S-box-containing protein